MLPKKRLTILKSNKMYKQPHQLRSWKQWYVTTSREWLEHNNFVAVPYVGIIRPTQLQCNWVRGLSQSEH